MLNIREFAFMQHEKPEVIFKFVPAVRRYLTPAKPLEWKNAMPCFNFNWAHQNSLWIIKYSGQRCHAEVSRIIAASCQDNRNDHPARAIKVIFAQTVPGRIFLLQNSISVLQVFELRCAVCCSIFNFILIFERENYNNTTLQVKLAVASDDKAQGRCLELAAEQL